MTDKTEFARIVPMMIQEKAAEWLLQKLDDGIDELIQIGINGPIQSRHLDSLANRAGWYGKFLNNAFVSQYADAESESHRDEEDNRIGEDGRCGHGLINNIVIHHGGQK